MADPVWNEPHVPTDGERVCVVTSMRHYENTDETYFGADGIFVDSPDRTARQKAEDYILADKEETVRSEELEDPNWDPDTYTLTEGDATFKWAIDDFPTP